MPRPGVIERFRVRVVSKLPDTCSVMRQQITRDSEGNVLRTWVQVGANVPCLLQGVSPRQLVNLPSMAADERQATTTYAVYFPYLTDVQTDDQLRVGGRKLNVMGRIDESYEIAVRVVAREITTPGETPP
jgi:head-tail adaptor